MNMHGIYMDAGILGGSDSGLWCLYISECTYSTHGTYMDPRSPIFFRVGVMHPYP